MRFKSGTDFLIAGKCCERFPVFLFYLRCYIIGIPVFKVIK